MQFEFEIKFLNTREISCKIWQDQFLGVIWGWFSQNYNTQLRILGAHRTQPSFAQHRLLAQYSITDV